MSGNGHCPLLCSKFEVTIEKSSERFGESELGVLADGMLLVVAWALCEGALEHMHLDIEEAVGESMLRKGDAFHKAPVGSHFFLSFLWSKARLGMLNKR